MPLDHVGLRVADLAVSRTHVAFTVDSRDAVRALFDNAVAHGATVKSAPALFPEYHARFYAAMVFDPDRHNIEVVCHAPRD